MLDIVEKTTDRITSYNVCYTKLLRDRQKSSESERGGHKLSNEPKHDPEIRIFIFSINDNPSQIIDYR